MSVPYHRWGVRYTLDPTRTKTYLQAQYDADNTFAKRGELFLNENKKEIYFVDGNGVAKSLLEDKIVPYSQISFTGLREFADDAAAAAGTPPIAIGGMYRTGSTLKVRIA